MVNKVTVSEENVDEDEPEHELVAHARAERDDLSELGDFDFGVREDLLNVCLTMSSSLLVVNRDKLSQKDLSSCFA